MSVRSFAPGKEVSSPRGAWSALAQKRRGSPERASFAQNCRFAPGVVHTRPGTTAVVTAFGKVTGIYNWTPSPDVSYVLMRDGGVLRFFRQAINTSSGAWSAGTNILTLPSPTVQPVYRPCFTESLGSIYLCGYRGGEILPGQTAPDPGAGTLPVYIWDFDNATSGLSLIKAFRARVPINSAASSDAGAGHCSIGTHYFGIVYQNRTGFAGRPSTQTVLGAPLFATLGTNNRRINLDVTVTGTLLIDAGLDSTMYVIMTRADNPNKWYFVPELNGSIVSVLVGDTSPFSYTIHFELDVSDEDLAVGADPAGEQFLLLSQDDSGLGPFQPNFVVSYGPRMVYGVGTKLYISDQNNAQFITEDQHVVLPPLQRRVGYAFPLTGSLDLYMTGDRWTARITDNSDRPITWASPIQISEALGAPYPCCVCHQTRGNYAWIITEGGPYVFAGMYADQPVTALVDDLWARVNWDAAFAIECADDTKAKRFYVAVPLDGAFEPTHIFCIDYTNGLTYDQVDISLDKLPAANISSVGVVRDVNTGTDLWIGPTGSTTSVGPGAGSPILRFDPAQHRDAGPAGIDCIWESGLVRAASEFPSRTVRAGGLDLWIRGAGPLLTTVSGTDKQRFVQPQLSKKSGTFVQLEEHPGTFYQQKLDLSRIENYTVQFRTNSLDAWFELSSFTAYHKGDLFNK